jgi:hypothetical protein
MRGDINLTDAVIDITSAAKTNRGLSEPTPIGESSY